MSQTGQFRQYAEEGDSARRKVSSPWKFSPPVQASEYHLINLATGVSHGGFETLSAARQRAREEGLAAWTSSMEMFGSSTTIRAVRPIRNKLCGQPRRWITPAGHCHLQPAGRWRAQMTFKTFTLRPC
jgi:hypothetical protein